MTRDFTNRHFWSGGCVLPAVVIGLVCFAAWLTHVIHCIKTEEWLFLIAGAIAAPVAVVHGIGLWFGFWG